MTKLVFLGSGTSHGVPVIACTCEVCSSADPRDSRLRSSVYIQEQGVNLVIDTGPDFRAQMLREKISAIDGILFTHEHKDHTAGLDDIRAYNYIQNAAMDVYATDRVLFNIKKSFDYIFSDSKYPGIPEVRQHTITNQPFEVKGVAVTPIQVTHLHMPVFGFKVGNVAYITDANHIEDEELKKIAGVEVLVLNALRITPHISHYSLMEAIEVALKVGAGRTYFTHISHQLGLHQQVQDSLPENIFLAHDGLIVEA